MGAPQAQLQWGLQRPVRTSLRFNRRAAIISAAFPPRSLPKRRSYPHREFCPDQTGASLDFGCNSDKADVIFTMPSKTPQSAKNHLDEGAGNLDLKWPETKLFVPSLHKGRGPVPALCVPHCSHKRPAKPPPGQQCQPRGLGVARGAEELMGERGFAPPTASYFPRKPGLQKPCGTWRVTEDSGCNCHCGKEQSL